MCSSDDNISVSLLTHGFAIRRLNKYILNAEGRSKGTQATQSVKWNETYKHKEDMKYPGYKSELVCAQC